MGKTYAAAEARCFVELAAAVQCGHTHKGTVDRRRPSPGTGRRLHEEWGEFLADPRRIDLCARFAGGVGHSPPQLLALEIPTRTNGARGLGVSDKLGTMKMRAGRSLVP